MELLPAIFTFYNIVFHFELIKYIFYYVQFSILGLLKSAVKRLKT